jgi:hypothetical protein
MHRPGKRRPARLARWRHEQGHDRGPCPTSKAEASTQDDRGCATHATRLRTQSLMPYRITRIHHVATSIALSIGFAHAAIPVAEPVIQTTAYRCTGPSGSLQYQQTPCEGDKPVSVRIGDQRTAEQQKVAKRMAERDRDLAHSLTYWRHRHDSQALKATAQPESLTIQPRQKAKPTEPITAGVKVVPRKRDFRAVSAKPDGTKTRKTSQSKAKSSTQPT